MAIAPDTFSLPGGLVLEERTISALALSPLTGFGEHWLAEHPRSSNAHATTALLSQCLAVPDGTRVADLARRLLVGDRDFLMLQLRRLTLGNRMQAVIRCGACDEKIDLEIDADAIAATDRPQAGRF